MLASRPSPPCSTIAPPNNQSTPADPNFHEAEATLVDAEVYTATLILFNRNEQILPWSQRTKFVIVGLFVIISVLAVITGTLFLSCNDGNTSESTFGNIQVEKNPSTGPPGGLSHVQSVLPSQIPLVRFRYSLFIVLIIFVVILALMFDHCFFLCAGS